MEIHSRKLILIIVMTLIASVAVPFNIEASTSSTESVIEKKIYEDFRVSDGVQYTSNLLSEYTQESNTISGNNAMRVLKIDTTNPFTQVKLGYPTGLKGLKTTTSQALNYHTEQNKVVGAVNGSFNHLAHRMPMHLISQNNRLVFSGSVSENTSDYVNQPIAFGVNNNGNGMIDHYQLKFDYTYNKETYQITGINKNRTADSTILYTPDFHSDTTETNYYGREIVVSLPSRPNLTFGKTYEGSVVDIREKYEERDLAIPENGFVLSGHGKGQENLNNIQLGDSISVAVDIDEKWKNASFMLASGPLLVKDGKVNLSIDPDSLRAITKAPRTAVAIDETGEKVFFVTVDGRQAGYSDGMNMLEFANYLVEIGVDRALNMDGGGSTTMATRYPGQNVVQIANSPSDGRERGVSSILMAVSTAPDAPYYADVLPSGVHNDAIHWLTTKGIQGYPNGKFGVDDGVTRPHAAVIFTKAMGLDIPNPEEVENYFEDIDANHPYAPYIAAVAKAGIFNGDGINFLPDMGLTREQMATTLVHAFDLERLLEKKNMNDVTQDNDKNTQDSKSVDEDSNQTTDKMLEEESKENNLAQDNSQDKDEESLQSSENTVDIYLDNVGEVHKDDVQTIANLGITKNLDNYLPQRTVTRGQFASFLYRTINLLKQQ